MSLASEQSLQSYFPLMSPLEIVEQAVHLADGLSRVPSSERGVSSHDVGHERAVVSQAGKVIEAFSPRGVLKQGAICVDER